MLKSPEEYGKPIYGRRNLQDYIAAEDYRWKQVPVLSICEHSTVTVINCLFGHNGKVSSIFRECQLALIVHPH